MTAPRYLLLLRPGRDPEQLVAFLRGCGLHLVADIKRGDEQPRVLGFVDEATEAQTAVEYREDHRLGQRLLYTSGPRAAELAQRCADHWPCWSAAEALSLAERAEHPADKVATLAPLAALLTEHALREPEASARAVTILGARLKDAVPAVRRAALVVASSAPDPQGAALLRMALGDPQLGAEARRQLAARAAAPADPVALGELAEAALSSGDLMTAQRQLDRALQLDPLASWAYFARARVGAAGEKPWPALLDVTMALAVARRQGVHLQAMQELQSRLREELLSAASVPTAAAELHGVALVTRLLALGKLHEVEEMATALLPLPGRAALWWLAIALARRQRGRTELAIAALEAALTVAPRLRAARFLLGECRRELGDLEGAVAEFAQLDAKDTERPPPPSLLDVYADELLGVQAPWEAREHAFVRVRLLRELGQTEAALAVSAALLAREAEVADALLAHAILLGELSRPAEALAVLDRALAALRPEERLVAQEDPLAVIQLQRAHALAALARLDEAAVALRAALRISPELAAQADPALTKSIAEPVHVAGYAALRRLAQESLLSAAASSDASDALSAAALRGVLAELLVGTLAALDGDAEPAAIGELVDQARRGLLALELLLPPPAASALAAARATVEATAAGLGAGHGAAAG